MTRNLGQELLEGVREMTNDRKRQDAQKFCKLVLKVRRLQKMISTYYQRLEENLYEDGCFRGYFNHCSTNTGRLTSDLQQVPSKSKSKVKMMFITRYKVNNEEDRQE